MTVRGHRQPHRPNAEPALYTPDTMCEFVAETHGIGGRYLVTRAAFSGEKGSRTTELTMVPEGTDLTA